MNRRPTRKADATIDADPGRANFFELSAAAQDPAATSAFVLSAAPVPKLSELSTVSHNDPYSNPSKHRSKRVFAVNNAPSHEHLTSPRPQPSHDPARHAHKAAHRAAPFATSAHGESAEPLHSSGRSLTPTRLRATPSPSRSHGFSRRNSSSADNPFSPRLAGGDAAAASAGQNSPRGLRTVSPGRATTPPRHPIIGEGLSPERDVRTRSTRSHMAEKLRAASVADPLSHDPFSPVATELLSADSQRPIARRAQVASAPSRGDSGPERERVLGEGVDPQRAAAEERRRAKIVSETSTRHVTASLLLPPTD